jgi:hypothetical protein
MTKSHTTVDFEVEGSTVENLMDNAVATATQVAGEHDWTIVHAGHVEPVEYYVDSYIGEIPQKSITRWKQEFRVKVDF